MVARLPLVYHEPQSQPMGLTQAQLQPQPLPKVVAVGSDIGNAAGSSSEPPSDVGQIANKVASAAPTKGVVHRLPLVYHSPPLQAETPLPATCSPPKVLPSRSGSSQRIAPKPERLPSVSTKPCRVAQRTAVSEEMPQQKESLIAELPAWAKEAAIPVQENPFFR
jgi:hypothetical protein